MYLKRRVHIADIRISARKMGNMIDMILAFILGLFIGSFLTVLVIAFFAGIDDGTE